jgi:integrase/recombinase XerC/integrase/recombinase XerD
MSERALVPIEGSEIVEGQWEETALAPALALPSVPELVVRFLASHDVRASSRATYKRMLKRFCSWLEESGRRLVDMRREDVLAYRDALKEQGLSSYSVSSYLSAVKQFFSWLEAERIYPNAARGVKGPKRPKGHAREHLTAQELRAAVTTIEQDEELSEQDRLRDVALFHLVARTGLRTIEASRARVGDVRRQAGKDGKRHTVLYIEGKGRDAADEYVVLEPEAERPLRAYLKARGPITEEAPLFASSSPRNMGEGLTTRSISRILKRAIKAAGLDDRRLTAHSLRHSAITLAIQGGASLEQAQAMARHASPMTTMIYFHNAQRLEQAAERYIRF